MKERTAGVIGYNSLENPIGIETVTWQYEIRDGKKLQLIRKPDRDWNFFTEGVEEHPGQLQLIRKPDRDWNLLSSVTGETAEYVTTH